MKSDRRSLRNHHDGHHEPGDPLGVYLPPLAEWSYHGREYVWQHPSLPILFYIKTSRHPNRTEFAVRWTNISDPEFASFAPSFLARGYAKDVGTAYGRLKTWYAGTETFRLDGQTHVRSRSRSPHLSERNPDWSEVREKASHYAGRAAAGARSAYDWTAPRARAAYDWTAPRARAAGHAAWEGTKAAGRAVKRGAKRAAPVIARGAKSAAERMDRWAAEPNGAKYSVYVSGSGWHDSWTVKGGLATATAEARHAVSGRNEVVSASVYKMADRSARDVVKFTNRDSHGNVGRVRKIGT